MRGDVGRLLVEVGADAAGGIAVVLGDVEDAEGGVRPERRRNGSAQSEQSPSG
jgi:hypothetical protein